MADAIVEVRNLLYVLKCVFMTIMNEIDNYLQRLKAKDPLFDAKVELGQLLMRPVETLTEDERKRRDELAEQFSHAT